jgi:SagB-type dehydrogenase family enzyme
MAAHNRDVRAALAYHDATKHSQQSLAANRHLLDWENQPLPFKIYRDLESIPLVQNAPENDHPALEAIAALPRPPRTEGGAKRTPDLASLSRLLYLSAGITKRKRYPGREVLFRAYPNTGALYHIDLYLIAAELPGVPAGVYHFSPHDFALRCLRQGDHRSVLVEASGGSPDLARAPLVVASASTYWRNAWKYQARAYRHCFWDAGTLHANLLAVAETQGLEPRVIMGFTDRRVEAWIGSDPRAHPGSVGAIGSRTTPRTSAARARARDRAALALGSRLRIDPRHARGLLARRRRRGAVLEQFQAPSRSGGRDRLSSRTRAPF